MLVIKQPVYKELLQNALKLRAYSRKTIKAYCNQVQRFPLKSTVMTTSNFQYCLGLLERGSSHSSVNQTISTLHFYWKHAIHHPKKQVKLPQVLSEKGVPQLLKSVTNPKHKAILSLNYSSRLCVGEVVSLCFSNLDIERKSLLVRQRKGQKDRRTLLSNLALDVEGFWRSKTTCRIVKKASIHALRHSFAGKRGRAKTSRS